jgi:hypothetical protein
LRAGRFPWPLCCWWRWRIYVRQHSLPEQLARSTTRPAVNVSGDVSDAAIAGLNDEDLLQEAAQQSPAMQAQYSDNLRRVNEYIQDEKGVVAADPNDQEARRSLMEAYQQKAMLFELAMDRSDYRCRDRFLDEFLNDRRP